MLHLIKAKKSPHLSPNQELMKSSIQIFTSLVAALATLSQSAIAASIYTFPQNYPSLGSSPANSFKIADKAVIIDNDALTVGAKNRATLLKCSESNPCIATNNISLSKGYLFLMSDDEDIVNSYNKKIYTGKKQDESDTSKFCIVTNNGQKGFGGFPIDNRNRTQGIVFNLLKEKANGSQFALNTKRIMKYLQEQKEVTTESDLRLNTLLPLKRSGLIGVSSTGYFHINTTDDLRDSYNYHKTKLDAIQKTLDMYKKRAALEGVIL